MIFKIGQTEVKKREKNIMLGLLFSILFVAIVMLDNDTDRGRYNDFLLASIVLFFLFSNVINGIRHLQWKKMIQVHSIDVLENEIAFLKDTEKTTLKIDQIDTVHLKQRGDLVTRIILKRVNGNKIRLEGYDEMDALAKSIIQQVKPDQVVR